RDDAALDGHRAGDRERDAYRPRGLERAMREEAVVADRDAEAGDRVHEREDREVLPADRLVPQQHDRAEERDERKDDGDEVGDAMRTGHGFGAYDAKRGLSSSRDHVLTARSC